MSPTLPERLSRWATSAEVLVKDDKEFGYATNNEFGVGYAWVGHAI